MLDFRFGISGWMYGYMDSQAWRIYRYMDMPYALIYEYMDMFKNGIEAIDAMNPKAHRYIDR